MSKHAVRQHYRQGSGEPSDRELLARHAEGDPHAFAELVYRHRDRMWAVALRTLGDPEEAADALQDACLSAFRAAGSFRGDAGVTTWLHRIVVNACLDRIRRKAARPAVPMADDAAFEAAAPPLPDPADAHGVALVVHAALKQLPFEQRSALTLVDMMGYSIDEAARVLEVPPGTIKSRCARGRARLSPLLESLRSSGSSTGTPGLAEFRASLRRLRNDPAERRRVTAIAADAVSDELPVVSDDEPSGSLREKPMA